MQLQIKLDISVTNTTLRIRVHFHEFYKCEQIITQHVYSIRLKNFIIKILRWWSDSLFSFTIQVRTASDFRRNIRLYIYIATYWYVCEFTMLLNLQVHQINLLNRFHILNSMHRITHVCIMHQKTVCNKKILMLLLNWSNEQQ